VTNEAAIEALRRRIAASGLSQEMFAHMILLRELRTVTRWLSGDSPIPKVVKRWLK
jgi:DNA-binding transcriptional regulator YiaG